MKVRKPLPLSTHRIPRTAVKRKGRSSKERQRIYGPRGYIEWIHERPCAACGVIGWSECAHIKTGGMGRKDDWTRTIPLCGPHTNPRRQTITIGCHRMYDLRLLALPEWCPPELLAAETQAAWLAHLEGKL
jgi:hypothetical protein